MNKPLISIITVSYNAVSMIEKTIKSVINQTYNNIEYIIIDGGSTDGTINIIKKYEDNITLWLSEGDEGVYDAMNKGIRIAKGEWINFMNAGDVFVSPYVLEKIFNNRIPDSIKFLYSNYFIEKKNHKLYVEASLEKGIILHQSSIYKKELHYTYGFYQVTSPIIISDFLFFCSIPDKYYSKTSIEISINDGYGISSQPWSFYQKTCADYIYGRCNITELIIKIIKFKIRWYIYKMFNINK